MARTVACTTKRRWVVVRVAPCVVGPGAKRMDMVGMDMAHAMWRLWWTAQLQLLRRYSYQVLYRCF